MNADDISIFLDKRGKILPSVPVWMPDKARSDEMRARLSIEVDGVIAGPEIEMTVRTTEPGYLVIVIVAPKCITRLCLSGGHRNKVTGETIQAPHFHGWSQNRELPARLRETLPFAEPIPSHVQTRDAAFAWFLHEVGIESPDWLPVSWPGQGALL